MNQALKKSSGEHILVLNPDSILQDKSIDKILMHSRRNKKDRCYRAKGYR